MCIRDSVRTWQYLTDRFEEPGGSTLRASFTLNWGRVTPPDVLQTEANVGDPASITGKDRVVTGAAIGTYNNSGTLNWNDGVAWYGYAEQLYATDTTLGLPAPGKFRIPSLAELEIIAKDWPVSVDITRTCLDKLGNLTGGTHFRVDGVESSVSYTHLRAHETLR